MNVTVTTLAVRPGNLSGAKMVLETAVTWPPSEPEATPALTRSLRTPAAVEVGPTEMPHEDPEVAAPMVAPLRVTVMVVPAANEAPVATVSITEVAAGVAAVKVGGVAVRA